MEAPEKVYLLFNRPYLVDYAKLNKRRCEEEVEYIRTDAFIEKACAFLKDRIAHDSIDYPMATNSLIEDFKKYMEE